MKARKVKNIEVVVTEESSDNGKTKESVKAAEDTEAMSKAGKIFNGVKVWIAFVLSTGIMLALDYFVVLAGTICVPTVLSYILGGLGFSGTDISQSSSVFIVSLCAGVFLTAWLFVFAFVIVKIIWRSYVNAVSKFLPDKVIDKLTKFMGKK